MKPNFNINTPTGAILDFAGAESPEGWLICDGSAVSRTTYAKLFKVIGTTFGSGDGSTTFNLPDMRKRVSVGKDSVDSDFDILGKTGGEKTHIHTLENGYAKIIDNGQGTFILNSKKINFISTGQINTNASSTTYNNTEETWATSLGGTTDNSSNLQPYIVMNKIIKY